jgi:prepilin signal peptidase PulO-like enzyme (type II secretory pathway)
MIPNRVIFPAIVLGIISVVAKSILLGSSDLVIEHIYSILLVFGFFLVLFLISGGKWIGAGDVKFGILIGLVVPWPVSLAVLFLSFVLGAIFGIILLIMKKKKIKEKVPFGTFLVAGTFLAYFFGDILVNWYLGLIL